MNKLSQSDTSPAIGIGIDYGTSNSAAALFDGKQVYLVQLEQDNPVMPSATYVDRDYKILTGQQAIEEYIISNMGRTVELSAEVLGEGRTSTGQIGDHGPPKKPAPRKFTDSHSLMLHKKAAFPGHQAHVGQSAGARLMVFERPFRLVALITPLLLRIHRSIVERLRTIPVNHTVDHACIGHPVNFEGAAAQRNNTALDLLSEAYGYAEFREQRFYPEPIAASLSYLHDFPAANGQLLLAVDFGGGTLDLCIIKREQDNFSVIATHGVGLGGDHIDQLLFRKLLFPLLGKGERWRRKGQDREIETLFPFEEYEELLLNWAISYMLNQNRFTSPLLQRMEYEDAGTVKFRRLYDLIKNNYSYLVFQTLKDIKATLSDQEQAKLDIPELDLELTVTRQEFETHIEELLQRFRDAIQKVLDNAGLEAEAIQLVIRTGGSCLIPAVREILDELFPDKVTEHDPFTSVAAGLAIADYYGLGTSRSEHTTTDQD